jgi:flagellar biosynthesis/type III secretory pathway protein FliH
MPSCRTDTFFTKYNEFSKHLSNRHVYMRTVCVTCRKVSPRKYDAKRHNSSAGKSHVCLEERAVNPTYQDKGNARKFVYPDLQERQRKSEEDQRQADEERKRDGYRKGRRQRKETGGKYRSGLRTKF